VRSRDPLTATEADGRAAAVGTWLVPVLLGGAVAAVFGLPGGTGPMKAFLLLVAVVVLGGLVARRWWPGALFGVAGAVLVAITAILLLGTLAVALSGLGR